MSRIQVAPKLKLLDEGLGVVYSLTDAMKYEITDFSKFIARFIAASFMSPDTTKPGYWLNWRFLICAIWIFSTIAVSSFIIWKFEGSKRRDNERRDHRQVPVGFLYKDEAWRTCLKGIPHAWLLVFRVFAFVLLLALIIGNTVADGGGIFYFYTQWTFTLVTIYFGIASAFSCYGCWRDRDGAGCFKSDFQVETERGSYVAPKFGESENEPEVLKILHNREEDCVHETAGSCGYLFQIMYQVCAGAVVLTDVVFWLILFPFLAKPKLTFYVVSMHSVNAVLVVDAILNCMRFPVFRIAYFVVWTGTFVIFQWIFHACVSIWWPYPFLDLSSPYAPLWYFGVGLLHVPCYCFFVLMVRLKHFALSRAFPESYQPLR